MMNLDCSTVSRNVAVDSVKLPVLIGWERNRRTRRDATAKQQNLPAGAFLLGSHG
jgi:hypothetical protein